MVLGGSESGHYSAKQGRSQMRPNVLDGQSCRLTLFRAGSVPTHDRLGPDDCEKLQDRRKPPMQLDKEPAITVREPDATAQLAPQDDQLMSKHRVLSFKPQLRLEWRGEDGQNETEQPDHSATLGDSVTLSTRIGFSVHTTSAIIMNVRQSCLCPFRFGHGSIKTPGFIIPFGSSSRLAPRNARAKSSG